MKTKLALFIRKNKADIIFFLLLTIFSFVFYLNNNQDADEGLILSGAWHIINGQTLYLDFFEKISPGSFYFVALIFKVFGANYFFAKFASIVMLILCSFLIYKTSSLIKKSTLNYLPALIFILSFYKLPLINHNFFSTFFIISSCFFYVLFIKKNQNIHILMAGILSGFAIIFLQHKGLLFWGASGLFLLFYLIKYRTKTYLVQTLLYTSGSIFPILLVLTKWPARTLYENLLSIPLGGYIEVNRMPYYIIIAFSLLFFIFCCDLLNKKNRQINYLLFVQLFLLISCLPLPDFYHLYLSCFPLLMLSPILFKRPPVKINELAVVVLWLMFLLLFFLNMHYHTLSNKSKNSMQELKEIVETECPGKYLFTAPFSPNFYFEFKKLNATPYSILIEKDLSPMQFDKALLSFQKTSPSCAILLYYPNIKNQFGHTGNNVLERYIRENYKIIYSKDGLLLYRNKRLN